MYKTIGIFAHVDGGKTTFTEQISFSTGSRKSLGRVDDGTSAMDSDELEKKRGITIFADQEQFLLGEDTWYIIDTPGHTDFCGEGNTVHIRGRGPVSEFMDYSVTLASATKGSGSVSFLFDGYDICGNQEAVMEEIGYNKERDMENTSASVFCAKGAAFTVPWQEAERYMHTLKE